MSGPGRRIDPKCEALNGPNVNLEAQEIRKYRLEVRDNSPVNRNKIRALSGLCCSTFFRKYLFSPMAAQGRPALKPMENYPQFQL